MSPPVLISLVSALAAAIVALVSGAVAWRKARPESESLAVGTLRTVIEEVRGELERKDRELREARSDLSEAWKKLHIAERQLRHIEERWSDEPPGHLA